MPDALTRPGIGVLVLAGGRGTRLPTTGAWSKHLEPLPGIGSTVIDEVLDRVSTADDLLVALGHHAAPLRAHLARHWPRSRCFTVPSIDDLAASTAEGLSRLGCPVAAVVEGDVIPPRRAMRDFLSAVTPGDPELHLLIGVKPARPDRATFALTPVGEVTDVRPTESGDGQRFSVLAAACEPRLAARLTDLSRPHPRLAGLGVSLWHTIAARLIEEGHRVRAITAPDGGVNVNTPDSLIEAADYVRRA